MISSMEFWQYATYAAVVVAIVGPLIILVTGVRSSYEIFFKKERK